MNRLLFICLSLCSCAPAAAQYATHEPGKTSFQTADAWQPEVDVRSDIVMVYGMGSDFRARAASWRSKGYNIQFMTGAAWGNYQDYFNGKFDGRHHDADIQTDRDGKPIMHGPSVPYIVPSASYIAYMKTQLKKAIDFGVSAIYLEEPEYWARAGYSSTFKKEWQTYYHSPWQAQHTSPEAAYLSQKLKYRLYFNEFKELFLYVKSYSHGKVKCLVATHSLLNYSAWGIVSPEASLAALPGMDGYIAQVWTGTARVPNYYNGVEKERVFENAFLEYNAVTSMVAPARKTVYLLSDPIEDGIRSWDDYKQNYQAVFTAELMFPATDHFEVMPWPNRIYLGKYKVADNPQPQPIAPSYATQMQVMINALNDMPKSANTVSGTKGISVLLDNSLMFQTYPEHKGYHDPWLSDFYGMAMPLFKRGVPVQLIHMENLAFPDALKGTKVLIMSYADMKPQSAMVHRKLAAWVKAGGILLYYGKDDDSFQQVKEWWNTGSNHFKTPLAQLLNLMKVSPAQQNTVYTYGKGKLYITRTDPKELVLQKNGDADFIKQVQQAYEQDAHAGKIIFKNAYRLDRGPYTLAAVMDENEDKNPLTIQGPLIDLYDPALPILVSKTIAPGQQAFLYRVETGTVKTPKVLAAAARVYDFKVTTKAISFTTKSPDKTNNAMRIQLPAKPLSITVNHNGKSLVYMDEWNEVTHTLLLKYENYADGVSVRLSL